MPNLFKFIEDNIDDALNEVTGGEDVDWLLSFQIIPTDQGPQPVVFIATSAPSGLLGQNLFAMTALPLGNVDKIHDIKALLRNNWQQMMNQRSQILGTPIDAPSKLIVKG